MAIQNAYNPKPLTVNEILKKRQAQADVSGEVAAPVAPQENFRVPVLGTEITPDYKDKPFLTKIGEDAAMLAYAIPVGLAQAVSNPYEFVKSAVADDKGDITRGAIGQSVRDAVDPEYYKAHPLLGVVNLAGFVTPIAGAVKNAALKTSTKTAATTALKEATALGISQDVVRTSLRTGINKVAGLDASKGAFATAIEEAAKTGKTEIVRETVRNLFVKNGVDDVAAIRIGSAVADNLYSTLSRQTTKMKILDNIAHPVSSSFNAAKNRLDPVRTAIFGTPEKTAVAVLYGTDKVSQNPEGFLAIERWAEAQVKERGMDNNVGNRQRVMQDWVEQNSQWASLTPDERVLHFKNYAEQDLARLKIHEQTGMDLITTKALPQNYVDSMVQTLRESTETDGAKLLSLMEDNFGADFTNFSAEVSAAMQKYADPKEAIIHAVSKLGNARSTISFAKFSPEIQELAKSLEKSGYRIGYAPKDKAVSFATDVFAIANKEGASAVTAADITVKKTALGQWLDRAGLSTRGTIEGAAEHAYRENFTQRILGDFADKYGSTVKAGNVSIPVEKLFDWIDRNRILLAKNRQKKTLGIRTVFDVRADDLVRAGFDAEIAKDIVTISRKSLREVPTSITGMGDALVNFMKTNDKGFGRWYSNVYNGYLRAAYAGRYDWSPFFSAQQYLETQLQSSLLLKDTGLLPGAKSITRLGAWTAEKLGKQVEGTATYLRKIIEEPPIEQVAMVKEEILGSLQKTMLDYSSSPDLINIQGSSKNAYSLLKDKAAFEESIKSRNIWYAATGQSSVRMATTFNKALAEKFGMSIDEALESTIVDGVKTYKNPEMVKMMKELTQSAFHYKEGVLTSPLVKTLNIVWFPFRFQAKTVGLMAGWLDSLPPVQKTIVMNNWVHFANWAGTDEGIEWRRTNKNLFYNILAYTTAYEQIGQSIDAVTKGRLFGGNAGLIGGVPVGVFVNIARELGFISEDPDQFDPKTGRRFQKDIPRNVVSTASFSAAIEQLIISMSPSTPFYSLTGGVIAGVSPSKIVKSLVRQVVGFGEAALTGEDTDSGYERLQRDFKRVPLEYNRLLD